MLEKLRILNWKAFADKNLEFSPGLNLFVGPNGSGKTTILDAVSLALTGVVPSSDFRSLVRDQRKESAIELQFVAPTNGRYLIKRRFTKERIIGAELVTNGAASHSQAWESVSAQLARGLRTESVFFSRISYMSEGEVFEYAKNPPSKAIDSAVQRVFGIGNLQFIADEIERIRKAYEKSSVSLRRDIERGARVLKAPQQDPGVLRQQLDQHRTELESRRQALGRAEERLIRLRAIVKELEKSKSFLVSFESACAETDLRFDRGLPLAKHIDDLVRRVAEKAHEQEIQASGLSVEKGAAQNRIKYYEGILNLLEPLSSAMEKEGVPCPVCHRPIDNRLGNTLLQETKTNLQEAKQVLERTEQTLRSSQGAVNQIHSLSQRLKTLSAQIQESLPSELKARPGCTFSEFEKFELDQRTELKKVEDQFNETQKSIAVRSKTVEEGALTLARLETSLDMVKVRERLQGRVIENYRGLIMSSILVSGLRKTIQDQRNLGLKPLYEALGDLWKKCRPDHDWQVMFDREGRIKLRFDSTELEFAQLSGGEKTVLLILARVLISAMFSDLDFLMLDEPLEHLDSRNRRSVLNFLVAATRSGLAKQVIVTTFEESLVRKYLENEGTKTTYLSSSQA